VSDLVSRVLIRSQLRRARTAGELMLVLVAFAGRFSSEVLPGRQTKVKFSRYRLQLGLV
jgi:hypothetical protein